MPRQPINCVVCKDQLSKYTCPSCRANYCTIACYNQHREICSSASKNGAHMPSVGATLQHGTTPIDTQPDSLQDSPPLHPLTSLKWPYVPDPPSHPDPLTRDDPKPLQLHQYEALATSPTIRTILQSNPRLCDVLTSINALRGAEREEAIQHALGVDSRLLKNDDVGKPLDEDTKVFREFADAVEDAVRGGREDMLGLDWD